MEWLGSRGCACDASLDSRPRDCGLGGEIDPRPLLRKGRNRRWLLAAGVALADRRARRRAWRHGARFFFWGGSDA